MKKRKWKNGNRYLATLVALTLLAGGEVSEARDHSVVSYNGYDVFDILYYDKTDAGNWVERFWREDDNEVLLYDFTTDMKTWLNQAGKQWAEILAPGLSAMKQPAQLIVGNESRANAFASYKNYDRGEDAAENNFKNIFIAGREQDYIDFSSKESFNTLSNIGFGCIDTGKYLGADQNDGNYGWSGDEIGQLPQQEQTVGVTNVMFHELGHALGIFVETDCNDKGNVVFSFDMNDPNDYNNHLLDQNGNRAKDGQIIVFDLDLLDEETKQDVNEHLEKYFIITDHKAYFTGNNVSQVLAGRKFDGQDGIPVNAVDPNSPDTYYPELSHIELERSLMSHQDYRSYLTFMEAELAVMQDIGYNIDRKNFYGRSIYNNDLKAVKNTQGFFARNEAGGDYIIGKANTATMGVGLHVYGSHNDITQTSDGKNDGSADLLACGAGAAGIRIDGVGNTVTLASDAEIQADGQNGVGILVAYGRDQQVNVAGNVSAMGDGGDAIRFDFGSNSMGGNKEYRGSFIRYARDNTTNPGNIVDSFNGPLYGNSYYFGMALNGELDSKMGSLSISGTVAGKDHAVYIAKNAFVDKIDIEDGAQVYGDIVSDWKHFNNGLYDGGWGDDKKGYKLKIQYGDKEYTDEGVSGDKIHYYDEYCSDLVTNLNINGKFAYAGNITGSDNMKLKINDGATMAYTGKADVVGVQVAEGASLYGGNYKVNEIEKYASFESVDNEAGKLINHGTIGALTGDSNMEIDGNLENDGTLQGYVGGSKGIINVTGEVVLNTGSKVTASGGIHGETANILQADGSITGKDNVGSQRCGLLEYDASLSEDGKKLAATARAKDSLEGANAQQAKDYATLNSNAPGLIGAEGADGELRAFYGLEKEGKALQAIDEIGDNNKKDGSVAALSAQTSTLNNRVLSSRLAIAMGQAPAMLQLGSAHLDAGEPVDVSVPVMLPQEKDETGWVKFSKNWGNTAGGSNYHGSGITLGYDWKNGDNQRNGWFASYTDMGYGHNDGSESLQDTRIGYYTGISKGADTMLLYGDLGYLDGDRSRMVNINTLGTSNLVKGDYTGWLVELGGEWKHALHAPGTKIWQVSPYGAMQMSYMKQNGYKETGSIKAYDVSGGHNFYSALEGGVEFTRFLPKGSLNFRLGLRQALCGTGYEAYENSDILGRSYTKSSRMDKTHFVTSLAVETELAPCWQLGAEVAFQKGAHDKDLMANLQLRWLW